jgi:hypothetical protein
VFFLHDYLKLDSFSEIARLLREGGALAETERIMLADKLAPPTKKAVRYLFKRARGYPASIYPKPTDPLVLAMLGGDLPVIADHLRHSKDLDGRIVAWLADQFDPRSPNDSRFVIKRARKVRRPNEAKLAEYKGIGEFVERKVREGMVLKAAIIDVMKEMSVKRAKAYRAYRRYKS